MKINYFAIAMIGLVITFWACSKNELSELSDTNTTNPDLPLFSSNNGPNVEVWEEMLFFSGQDHYDAVYEELDILNQEAPNEYEPTEDDYVIPNLFLDEYESSLGFYSLRKDIESAVIERLANGANPLEEDPDNHFIRDEIERTLLNKHMEVRIGESVFKQIDKTYSIEITDANLETLELSRADWQSVMHDENVVVYVSGSATFKPMGIDMNCGFSVAVTPTNPVCDNIGYRRFDVNFNNDGEAWNGREVDYSWNWGDGTPTETSSSIYAAHFREHTYSNPGTYTVTIGGIWDNNGNCSDVQTVQVTVGGQICDFNDNSTQTLAQTAGSSNRAFRGELWVKKTAGNGQNKFGGETKFYRKINGNWKERKADRIVVQVWGEHVHQNCTNTFNHAVSEWPYNAKKAKRTYNIGNSGSDYWGHLSGGVHSNHRVQWDGVTYQFNLEYPYCD